MVTQRVLYPLQGGCEVSVTIRVVLFVCFFFFTALIFRALVTCCNSVLFC